MAIGLISARRLVVHPAFGVYAQSSPPRDIAGGACINRCCLLVVFCVIL